MKALSFFRAAPNWATPWPEHRASIALMLGDTWGLGLVVYGWGVRLMLGWWHVCWHRWRSAS